MAFFKALGTIGIGRTDLVDISNESLIRIEKKLVAEQKLNNSISKNDVENVLKLIKEYPEVLKEISRYDCLYGILTGYDAEHIDTLARYPPRLIERMRTVISDYFTDELTDYVKLNISRNNWNNIRVLLHYRIFLNNAFIKILITRLEGRMEYALALMEQGIPYAELNSKVGYIRDKEFYFTIGEVDKRYFLKIIVRMVDLMKQHPAIAQVGFFTAVKQAMYYYDTNNPALANKLGIRIISPQARNTVTKKKLSTARIFYLIVVIGLALLNMARSCNV